MGVINMDKAAEIRNVAMEKINTGFRIRKFLMPMVLKATISESVLIRLNPASTPIKVDMGMVKARVKGRR
jgi:hypothetical protein